MKYRVHIYPIVRMAVEVEAENQLEALKKADETDLSLWADARRIEFADDIDGYLVDEVGDEGFANSRWYDKHHKERKG